MVLRWQPVGITIVGTGVLGATSDRLSSPLSILIDSSNTLYVADYSNSRIQKFTDGTTLGKTIAGQPGGLSGSSTIDLNHPSSMLLDPDSNLYVSDTLNHRVQFFLNGSPIGTTIAGTGEKIRISRI